MSAQSAGGPAAPFRQRRRRARNGQDFVLVAGAEQQLIEFEQRAIEQQFVQFQRTLQQLVEFEFEQLQQLEQQLFLLQQQLVELQQFELRVGVGGSRGLALPMGRPGRS